MRNPQGHRGIAGNRMACEFGGRRFPMDLRIANAGFRPEGKAISRRSQVAIHATMYRTSTSVQQKSNTVRKQDGKTYEYPRNPGLNPKPALRQYRKDGHADSCCVVVAAIGQEMGSTLLSTSNSRRYSAGTASQAVEQPV